MRASHARQVTPGVQQVVMGLPATWHGYLVGTGESLPALGREAFAPLLQARGETALAASTEPEKKKK